MRIITSLIIASVVGSTAVGALKHYMQETPAEVPAQDIKQLFLSDRPTALRIFKRTAAICLPELSKLKSNKARDFFPRMLSVTLDMTETKDKGAAQKQRQAIESEIRQLVRTIPESDGMLLIATAQRLKNDRGKVDTCARNSLRAFALEELQKRSKPLLSDVELRGS